MWFDVCGLMVSFYCVWCSLEVVFMFSCLAFDVGSTLIFFVVWCFFFWFYDLVLDVGVVFCSVVVV